MAVLACPECGNPVTKTLDTRPTDGGFALRRRRHCEKCDYKFFSTETVDPGFDTTAVFARSLMGKSKETAK